MLLDDDTKIPWQELIRARATDELRQILVRLIGSVVATIGAVEVRESLGRAAAQAAVHQVTESDKHKAHDVDATTMLQVLNLAADIDDICPPYRPFPFPWPWPWPPIGPEGPWGPEGPGGPVERGGELRAREAQLLAKVAELAKAGGLAHIAEAAQGALAAFSG